MKVLTEKLIVGVMERIKGRIKALIECIGPNGADPNYPNWADCWFSIREFGKETPFRFVFGEIHKWNPEWGCKTDTEIASIEVLHKVIREDPPPPTQAGQVFDAGIARSVRMPFRLAVSVCGPSKYLSGVILREILNQLEAEVFS
jgi:hypothetical protein